MNVAKLISARIRRGGKHVRIVGDVNAAIAANVGESGTTTHVSSRQHVVQRSATGRAGPGDPTTDEDGMSEREIEPTERRPDAFDAHRGGSHA